MSTLDIIILIPLLFGAYRGFRKGFLLEIVAILSFILAIIGGFKLLQYGIELINQHFKIQGTLLPFIAFFSIFIIIIIAVNLIGKILKKTIDLTLLGSVDSIVGAISGVFKWSFGISIVFWLTTSVGLVFPDSIIDNSLLYPYLVNMAPTVVEYTGFIFPFAQDLFQSIKALF